MQFRIVLLLVGLWLSVSGVAQQTVSPNAKEIAPNRPLQPWVEKQFGPDFKIDTRFEPMRGDFDGDGAEDLVIVATSKHPMGGSGGFNYRVTDPYDSYFGLGDPKITTQFATFGDGTGHCILIVHDWKAESPKSKWVIVNVPFSKIALGQATVKKHTVAAVSAVESGGMSSLVFFDGKKYRWVPNDFQDDTDPIQAR